MEDQGCVFSAADATERLARLGLESEPLRDVVRRSYHAFISCTANHPPLVRGIWAWGEAIRALREYTLPQGLRRSDERNYSVVVDDERRIALAVATGDEATGIAQLTPSTRSVKGSSTLLRVVVNQAQLSLFTEPELAVGADAEASESEIGDDVVTWILLIHRGNREVRCELSLPSSMGADGRINAWHERIILEAVPVDGEPMEITVPNAPDIDVDVQRRA